MRIISGAYKSRKIDYPKNRLTRPMTDRTKETLFNMVGSLIFGKDVLDLFSGSGSLTFESLSRGAKHVTCVDQAPWSKSCIEKNAKSLEIPSQKIQFMNTDIFAAIRRLEKDNATFSVIFVDPPFNKGLVKKALSKLDQSDIVMPFAQVVVGHASQESIPDDLQRLKLVRTKKIGQANLSFLFRFGIIGWKNEKLSIRGVLTQ